MKLTIKHYFEFKGNGKLEGNLDNASAWDALRLGPIGNGNVFAIPDERQRWQERCHQEPFAQEQARAIAEVVRRGQYTRINSYGAGAGFLEFFIKQFCPGVFLHCSDYTRKSMDRLRGVFPEANEVVVFDMFKDPWHNNGPTTLHLLYRVDTAFDNDQWRMVFKKMHAAGVGVVLFIPCEFLTLRRWMTQVLKYWTWPVLGKKITFAGYLRTHAQFLDLFSGTYQVDRAIAIGNLTGFLLTRK